MTVDESDKMTHYCGCDDKLSSYCEERWRLSKTDPCNVCTTDAFCTKKDSVTNITSHTLRTPYNNMDKVKSNQV